MQGSFHCDYWFKACLTVYQYVEYVLLSPFSLIHMKGDGNSSELMLEVQTNKTLRTRSSWCSQKFFLSPIAHYCAFSYKKRLNNGCLNNIAAAIFHTCMVPPRGLMLRIFTFWKNSMTSAGFEPVNLGSLGKHVT